MDALPTWLPRPLECKGSSIDADYEVLHRIFHKDLLTTNLTVDGFTVKVNQYPDKFLKRYENGFAHLVTVTDSDDGERSIDYDRAVRICWIKPIIENYTSSEVYAFWYKQAKGDVLYLWLADFDYVVILKPMKSKISIDSLIIVTAYHVDHYGKKDLQRRYGRADKIL